jgi:hypothetical protein
MLELLTLAQWPKRSIIVHYDAFIYYCLLFFIKKLVKRIT